MLVAPSSLISPASSAAPSLTSALPPRPVVPEGLLGRLAQVPDPRDPRGVRYRLATLLAIGVCALTSAGHNSLAAVAEWARRLGPAELQRLGCPFNPITGRYRVPDEGTLREAYAKVDPAALTAAGYERLAPWLVLAFLPAGPIRRTGRRDGSLESSW
ncbi:transposase family protein [Streptantibioticus ferralitis]|uniref:Transposase family protein n=1 Tax=Streptantibioticus ferralitis TaxID=236510 RepID=A0ABT5Z3V5_9ACTN|nr:transposase family protein [Streptantibioticus ferralitis]MDF2257730.1 transposase family protein [Streptantibioticus ferralitis]